MAGAAEFSLRELSRIAIAAKFPTTTKSTSSSSFATARVSYKEIKEREVKPIVMSWLSQSQRELLDKHAPERLTLPNGRTPKVNYENGKSPFISLRIQELYDVNQTPKIAMGRMPVTVHILTPGMKPIQVTQDLANFWREHYPKIKSELAAEISETFLAMTCAPAGTNCAARLNFNRRFSDSFFL